MTTESLDALDDLDPSRLPCGNLEKYIFTKDRNKLFSINDSNNTIDNGEGKQEINDNIGGNKSLFINGSDEYYYYKLLTIDNEIQNIYNNNELNNKLNELINEFDSIVKELEIKKKNENKYIPTNINNIIFRYKMRFLNNNDNNKFNDCIKKC